MAKKFGSFGWTGASGQQIGYADAYPKPSVDAFTADPVHGEAYDPNTPNSYAQVGGIGDVPVSIQGDDNWVDYGMGGNGWYLDNIGFPAYDTNMGTQGHDAPMGPAIYPTPDPGHQIDIFQLAVPADHGRNFYGQTLETDEVAAWKSSSTPAPNTGTALLSAREQTAEWPEPFDSTKPAPLLSVVRLTEAIPMRRLLEDDRPVYRQLAIPAQNIQPTGSVYNPSMQSNITVHNKNNVIPAFGRSPVQPWVSQEVNSPTDNPYVETDVFGGMSLQ